MNIARTFDSLLLKLLRSWLNILSLIKSIGRKGERMANPALGIGICFKSPYCSVPKWGVGSGLGVGIGVWVGSEVAKPYTHISGAIAFLFTFTLPQVPSSPGPISQFPLSRLAMIFPPKIIMFPHLLFWPAYWPAPPIPADPARQEVSCW